jgi:formylglycine-generating enzyme required for sulfatase activity
MKKSTTQIILGFAAVLCLIALPLQAQAKPAKAKANKVEEVVKERLVLMPLRLGEEDQKLQGAIETALIEGLQQKYEVFSGEQVAKKAREIFNKESRNTAHKECDETRCLQGIAEAFQAELLAVANITKDSAGYFIALSIRNLYDNKDVYSKSLPCKGCDAYAVIDKLKELVGGPAAVASAPVPIVEAPQPKVNLNDPDGILWAEAQKGNTQDDYQVYLDTYPKGKYAPFAVARVKKFKDAAQVVAEQQEQQAWEVAQKGGSEDSFGIYLRAYPSGSFAGLARVRIDRIKADAVLVMAKQKREAAEAAARAAQIKDCTDCPDMVVIPSGSFNMGSTDNEAGHKANESPKHRVSVSSFAMGKTEVTVGQFRNFAQSTGFKTDAENNIGGASGCYAMEAGKFDWRAGRYWDSPGFEQTEQQPVVCVSWRDANAYIKWLAQKTGKQYRLPTEAEWEYAARGNTDTARYWGDNPNEACRYANVTDTTTGPGGIGWGTKHECSDGYFFTAPVGSYTPNAFGLYDMLGNAGEWTADTYHDSYNSAPSDGSEWQGDGAGRVLRGGSWYVVPYNSRSAFRNDITPAARGSDDGFRAARTLP